MGMATEGVRAMTVFAHLKIIYMKQFQQQNVATFFPPGKKEVHFPAGRSDLIFSIHDGFRNFSLFRSFPQVQAKSG
jgi:hypothetical protein